MLRTQVLLEPLQYRFLKEQAKHSGKSLSAQLRDILNAVMVPPQTRQKNLFEIRLAHFDVVDPATGAAQTCQNTLDFVAVFQIEHEGAFILTLRPRQHGLRQSWSRRQAQAQRVSREAP